MTQGVEGLAEVEEDTGCTATPLHCDMPVSGAGENGLHRGTTGPKTELLFRQQMICQHMTQQRIMNLPLQGLGYIKDSSEIER